MYKRVNKKLKHVAVYAAVFFIFLFFATRLLYSQDPEKSADFYADEQLPGILSQEEFGSALPKRPRVEYNAGSLKDPFVSSTEKRDDLSQGSPGEQGSQSQMVSLDVQGLIWGGRFPQAIINNKVVKVGDEVGGAKVIDIAKDGVVVLSGVQTYKIPSPVLIKMESLKSEFGNSKGGLYE